ncbi:MAG TPA: rhamnulokinase family protein [Candidatus Aminicenantes bacterium]|nr:rhamnulokinase family protein [Candidatus Aminicenantes bacterium]
MKKLRYLAFDLGAESGRAILGSLSGRRLEFQEIHRFPNAPQKILGHLHWNIFSLLDEIKTALRICAAEFTPRPESLAVDTWGVDFGLLGRDGSVLGLPYSYRDLRTQGAMEEYFKLVPPSMVYELTGIQFMPFNSLFQLFVMSRAKSPILESASGLLFMPDLFNYLLTGRKATEFTIASTSQLLDPRTRTWNAELFNVMHIDPRIMQEVLRPGTTLAPLQRDIAAEAAMDDIPVVATAGHDTGAAVAAVPAEGDRWAYISSGTWSLVGVELDRPVITEESRDANFTNEGGVEGRIRFLKNVTGLWLVQQCRKAWAKDRTWSYGELAQAASEAPAFQALIDPDAPDFLSPADMPEAIRDYCRRTGQTAPETESAFIRCILESLALKYRLVLDQLQRILGYPLRRIHIIGGGSRNGLLCQFTADATGIPVVTGPVEATSIGNLLVQAMAMGEVEDLRALREIVRNSVDIRGFEPREGRDWADAYERFRTIVRS